jgi:hypothetical protein
MVFRSHPIGACCVLSGRLQGFIPKKMAHFEEHILTLHTACHVRHEHHSEKRTIIAEDDLSLHGDTSDHHGAPLRQVYTISMHTTMQCATCYATAASQLSAAT